MVKVTCGGQYGQDRRAVGALGFPQLPVPSAGPLAASVPHGRLAITRTKALGAEALAGDPGGSRASLHATQSFQCDSSAQSVWELLKVGPHYR